MSDLNFIAIYNSNIFFKGVQIPYLNPFDMPLESYYIGSVEAWDIAYRYFGALPEPVPYEERLARRSAALPAGWPVGFEQYLLDSQIKFGPFPAPSVPRSLPWTFTASVPPPPDHYAKRPVSELAAFKMWQCLKRGMTAEELQATHLVLGLSGRFRTNRMSVLIAHEGPRVDYLRANKVHERIDALLDNVNHNSMKLSPLHLAVTAMMDFLIIHPFEDGNGRMARLLFQWTLARHGILSKPIFPLLPAMRKGRAPFLLALYNWEFASNPQPLFDLVCHAVEPTLAGLESFIAQGSER